MPGSALAAKASIGPAGRTYKQPVSRSNAPKVVQHESAATAPAETSLHTTPYEPLTCTSDLHRPLCLQMVMR